MTKMQRYGLIGATSLLVVIVVAAVILTHFFAARLEPYIRQESIEYLQKRFDSDVELAALRVRMPNTSVLHLFRTRGRGLLAHVEGEGITLRHKGRRDLPPMFRMKTFAFDVDIGTLFDSPKRVPLVTLDGIEINIPPKGERPEFDKDNDQTKADSEKASKKSGVIIEEVVVNNTKLILLPRKQGKVPLQFDIHYVRLESAGKDVAMKYEASLTNAKPPGEIQSKGTFGPWMAREPGDTPVAGSYTFDKADLGVFKSIAGILHSEGQFAGTLSTINVSGVASVPDFRLKESGNRVPLTTHFQVLVDGTNGDTILQPVIARLGTTDFTTSGGIIKNKAQHHRAISLDVDMPKGNVQDLLRLAMKGEPFMQGKISLKTKIDIPPLSGKVKDKLLLDGRFEITNGKFLKSTIQEQIDTLSRRGQGQPKNQEIDEVVSEMKGAFHLEDQIITFNLLTFDVPGAAIDLTGAYTFEGPLDFHGTAKLKARVSQTMTGWKRWILKPVDPFFAKNGVGTFLRIKVEGSADQPKFGLDRGKDKP